MVILLSILNAVIQAVVEQITKKAVITIAVEVVGLKYTSDELYYKYVVDFMDRISHSLIRHMVPGKVHHVAKTMEINFLAEMCTAFIAKVILRNYDAANDRYAKRRCHLRGCRTPECTIIMIRNPEPLGPFEIVSPQKVLIERTTLMLRMPVAQDLDMIHEKTNLCRKYVDIVDERRAYKDYDEWNLESGGEVADKQSTQKSLCSAKLAEKEDITE